MLELTFTFSNIVPLPEDKKTKKQKTKKKHLRQNEGRDRRHKTLVGWGRGVTSQFSE